MPEEDLNAFLEKYIEKDEQEYVRHLLTHDLYLPIWLKSDLNEFYGN